MPLVSHDPFIEMLLSQQTETKDVIVLSSSVLVALIGVVEPDFHRAWDIPVSVVETRIPTGSVARTMKTVYLDKPLLRRCYSPLEINQLYYQTELERMCLDTDSSTSLHYQAPDTIIGKEAAASVQLNDDNLTYTSWSFGDLNLLIRCKIHGHVPDPSSKYKNARMIGVKAKLDFFPPDRGQVETTPEETAERWIYTFIRPDAHLLTGHIDASRSISEPCVLNRVERQDMKQILEPGVPFNPAASSKRLHGILQRILGYVVYRTRGDYLILVLVCHMALTWYRISLAILTLPFIVLWAP